MTRNNIFSNITEIHNLTFVNFCFTFSDITPMKHDGILVKLDYFYHNGFVPEEFVDYLQIQEIPFTLSFTLNFKRSFTDNVCNLFRFLKIKFSQINPIFPNKLFIKTGE